jgi:CheY-like chemotaxis protein
MIVAVSAYAMKSDEEKARVAGCQGYITKPINTRTFVSQIREYLAVPVPSSGSTNRPVPSEVHRIEPVVTTPGSAKGRLAEVTSALNAPPQAPVPEPSDRLRARIPEYLANCGKEVAAIEIALAAGDFVPIQKVGHNLKGTGSAYGFSLLTTLGHRLECAAKAGDRSEIAEQFKNLSQYLGAIQTPTAGPGRRG